MKGWQGKRDVLERILIEAFEDDIIKKSHVNRILDNYDGGLYNG